MIITERVYAGIQDKNRLEGYLPSKIIICSCFIQAYAYQTTFCTDPDSRVLLSSSFPESTYINANYVKVRKVIQYNIMDTLKIREWSYI